MADKKGITPLPWVHSRESVSDLGGWKPSEIFSFADEQNPKIIATLAARYSMDENAEYIVRACNAFPKMLEELNRVLAVCMSPESFDLEIVAEGLRAAIAAAKGEE